MEDDRFYVKTLTLENFRCFEKTTLGPFDPHFNLLVGENGSGKSSVLMALAELFRDIADVPAQKEIGPLLEDADVRVSPGNPRSQPLAQGTVEFQAAFDWFGQSLERREASAFPRMLATASKIPTALPLELRVNETYPMLAWFTTTRQFSRPSSLYRTDDPLAPPGRWHAFFGWRNAGASINELRRWLRDETLIAFEQAQVNSTSSASGTRPTNALSVVRGACVAGVEDATDISYIQARGDIVVTFTGGQSLEFATMRDGQRALVGLIAEIARRACVLNLGILGEKCLDETPGLVLIDEIDLHLHPKWQRQIVGALKRIFPKIQFFATTHSPQVIGQAKPEEIVLLTAEGKQERPSLSFGKDSNWVLECIMRAEGRDPGTAAKIKEMLKALGEGRFDDAKREMEALRDSIGEDPDIAAVDAYLWNLGFDGEKAAE